MPEQINKKFSLIKRIAKHGNQSIIVIPKILEEHLKPGTLVQLEMNVLQKIAEQEASLEEGR